LNFFDNNRKLVIGMLTVFCIVAALFTFNRVKPTLFENTFGFIITPIQQFNTGAVKWFKKQSDYIHGIDNLQKENETLKKELEEKSIDLSRLEMVEQENERLTELLDVSSRYKQYTMVAANIIAKDTGNWYNSFTIDRGTKDGLGKDMVVLTGRGLVGRVKECGYNYAKVTAIIDDTDAISAKSLRTDDLGYVSGDLANKGMCKMEYIDSVAELTEGDEVITSNLSDIFPPGITIGYIKEITADQSALTKRAVVKPAVDFKHLESVMVITTDFVREYTPTDETDVEQTTNQ
jgi:rod shape-determining protein MreC